MTAVYVQSKHIYCIYPKTWTSGNSLINVAMHVDIVGFSSLSLESEKKALDISFPVRFSLVPLQMHLVMQFLERTISHPLLPS